MKTGGYFRFYRRMFQALAGPEEWGAWAWFEAAARYDGSHRGEVLLTQREIAQSLGFTRSKTRWFLRRLEAAGHLEFIPGGIRMVGYDDRQSAVGDDPHFRKGTRVPPRESHDHESDHESDHAPARKDTRQHSVSAGRSPPPRPPKRPQTGPARARANKERARSKGSKGSKTTTTPPTPPDARPTPPAGPAPTDTAGILFDRFTRRYQDAYRLPYREDHGDRTRLEGLVRHYGPNTTATIIDRFFLARRWAETNPPSPDDPRTWVAKFLPNIRGLDRSIDHLVRIYRFSQGGD